MNKDYKQVEALYDNKNMMVHINAPSTDFVPAYLKYLLEYWEVPTDVEVVFSDNVIWQLDEEVTKDAGI